MLKVMLLVGIEIIIVSLCLGQSHPVTGLGSGFCVQLQHHVMTSVLVAMVQSLVHQVSR